MHLLQSFHHFFYLKNVPYKICSIRYIIIIFLCGQIVEHALAAHSEDSCDDTCDDTYCDIPNDPVSTNSPYLWLVIPQL